MTLEIMKYFKLLIIIIFTGFQSTISAQDLSEHLWKDRVLLVYTEDQASESFMKQLEELKSDMKGLDDRKLVLYSITPTHFRKGWENGKWEARNGSPDNFREAEGNFEIVLLGLDGRVKLRQDQLLNRDSLYNTIDRMPMRQRELKSRD
jgi:hypothetical protein